MDDLLPDSSTFWSFPGNDNSSNSSQAKDFPIPIVFNKIDTIFLKKLKEANLHIPHFQIKSIDELKSYESYIYIPFDYETIGLSEPPIAVFHKYHNYLFRQNMSNILLSLLLFTIVALSFFFISKTWSEQVRLTKLKNEFISNMTHELNTPIATIGIAIEALENFGAINDPIKQKEYLAISRKEVGRLKFLVDKVLKLSTLDQGYSKLNRTEVDLKILTQDIVHSLDLHLKDKNAKVNVDFTGSDFTAMVDREHFGNVIHNLIDNAIKYSKLEPRIEVKIESLNDSIKIDISDNGIGIPKVYHSKIFDRFFRVPNEDIHNVKGHGLGLHYVKSIIEKHGGSIELKDSNIGTSFNLSIPKQ